MSSCTGNRLGARFHLTCLMLAGIADAGLLAAWTMGIAPLAVTLAGHAALATGICLIASTRQDRTFPVVAGLSMLAMGPVGAIGAMILDMRLCRRPGTDDTHGERYRRLQLPSEAKRAYPAYESVREGRAFEGHAERAGGFAAVLDGGGPTEKQALLGTISQRYHPDFLPILKAALTSDSAPVRVSAAAVFAKLRETHRKSIAARPQSEGSSMAPRDEADRPRALAEAARSGLLNAADAQTARDLAIRMLLAERPAVGELDATETLLCGLLLEAERHEEVEARLHAPARILSPALRAILVRARMRGRRYGDIPSLVATDGERIAVLRDSRPAAAAWPLLASHNLER